MFRLSILYFLLIPLLYASCDTEGCTDPGAGNYDEKADSDDGSCIYDAEPFIGSWILNDSIQTGVAYQFLEAKQMLILTSSTDKGRVKIVWTYPNGITSDTIIASAKPNTLTIEEQDFGDEFRLQGTFIYDEFFDVIQTEYSLVKNNAINFYKGEGQRND
jgi:hypothetical protein